MQETVTLSREELQQIVIEAVAKATAGTQAVVKLGPELSENNLLRVREEAWKPGRQAVVLASGNGYRVYGYNEYQEMIARTSRLGKALVESRRGIFAVTPNGVAA